MGGARRLNEFSTKRERTADNMKAVSAWGSSLHKCVQFGARRIDSPLDTMLESLGIGLNGWIRETFGFNEEEEESNAKY